MTDYINTAAVRTQNRLGDGQPHARAMQHALPATTVELVEDVGLLGGIDSLPLIADAYQQAVCFSAAPMRTGEPAGE